MTDLDLATSLGSGLLRDLHATGLLEWGDVHVAQKVSYLYQEGDQSVQLALALAVRALRAGSICFSIGEVASDTFETQEESVQVPAELWPEPEAWRAAITASPLVAVGPDAVADRPLRLVGDRVYLQRYWQDETRVAEQLVARRDAALPVDLDALAAARDELFGPEADADQRRAAVVSTLSPVSVIAGGPGTGKTTTLARVLGLLVRTGGTVPLIGLAAPTGKAAVRMEEALTGALGGLPSDLAGALAGLRASTIHRLLGWVPDGGRTRFAHNRANPLPHDVVVVDEASMVSVTLMARLLDALRPTARLVLIGDPDQLAPVEAGAVLRDIVEASGDGPAALGAALQRLGLPPSGPVVRLTHNYRSVRAITDLAEAVLRRDADAAVELATSGVPGLRLAATVSDTDLQQRVVDDGLRMITAARDGDVVGALAALEEHRLLCAHRRGPFGVTSWSRQVEQWLLEAVPDFDPTEPWYPGRPLLVTQNATDLALYNGDTGVVVADGPVRHAHFARGDRVHTVSPFLLDSVQTIHAMTVHKSQGSQFERVTVILPPPDSPLLTRELLYTAITRAKSQVTLIGSPDSLRKAVTSPARPGSGLRDRL